MLGVVPQLFGPHNLLVAQHHNVVRGRQDIIPAPRATLTRSQREEGPALCRHWGVLHEMGGGGGDLGTWLPHFEQAGYLPSGTDTRSV